MRWKKGNKLKGEMNWRREKEYKNNIEKKERERRGEIISKNSSKHKKETERYK